MKFSALAIIILLFVCSCTRYLIRDVETFKEFTRKDLKIGLVGFNAFTGSSSQTSTSAGNRRTRITTTTTAFFDYQIQLKKELGLGEPMENFVLPGLKSDIPEENLKRFLDIYLGHTKASGVDELSTFMEIRESKSKVDDFKLKNNNVDYIIVGNHKPIFRERDEIKKGSTLLAIGAILTLFLIPNDWYEKTESTFYIFDKNLNLIDTKEMKDSVHILAGFLLIPNYTSQAGNITYGYAFRPHIHDYHNYIEEYFNKK